MLYRYIGDRFPDYTGKFVKICNELITGEVVVSLENQKSKDLSFWAVCFVCRKNELEEKR